jgi:hypothetical protein
MLVSAFGFFKILYLIGAVAFGVDIYNFLIKRGMPGLKAFFNTLLAVVILCAIVEFPLGFIVTIPAVAYTVAGLATILIVRAVYKLYRLINGNGSAKSDTTTPPKS